ncbi:MAG TPA: sigma-70 family RNA polymerase sigma factor [Terriglobales bacterium]
MDHNDLHAQYPSPEPVNATEPDLVMAISKGDPQAERSFVERYSPRLRVMFQARTHDADLAADLTQEALIELICALRDSRLREPSKLTSFVLGTARNILNSHFRDQQRSPKLAELQDVPAAAASVQQSLEQEQYLELAAKALATLDKTDNQILRMTLVEDMKPGAIAERLRLTSDVVRQRKTRATKRIVDFIRKSSQSQRLNHSTTGRA